MESTKKIQLFFKFSWMHALRFTLGGIRCSSYLPGAEAYSDSFGYIALWGGPDIEHPFIVG